MTKITRLLSSGAILLLVLSTACNMPAPPASGTLPAAGQVTNTPLTINTVVSDTPAPVIPITGMDVVSMQCQFCVNEETHAVLIMSSEAFFSVADPSTGVTCLSAKEMDGRRILLCRGAQNAAFTLNVCVDNDNCLEFPITLQPCPLVTGAGTLTAPATFVPLTPVILTPRNTLNPPPGGPSSGSPATATAAIVAPATTAPPNSAPTSTSAVPPVPTTIATTEPPPPEPTSTAEPATVAPPPPSTVSGGGGEEDSFVICHIPPGNPDQRRTMTVSQSDWDDEHSQHGDSRGAC